MNREMLVSLIIPSYNTPKEYLEKCLTSICEQPYRNIEVLVVVDGSLSKYYDDIRNLEIKDTRIKVIYKQHSGVSDTRNVGIAHARGEYITFVDADDTIPEEYLTNAIKWAWKYDYPDVIIGGIEYRPYRECNDTQFGEKEELFERNNIELLKKSMLHIRDSQVKYNVLGSPCGRLYKTSVIKEVQFPVGIALCEDQIFNRKVFLNAERILVVPEMWYVYHQNDFSVMHTKVKDNYWKMKQGYWDELYKLDFEENDTIKDGMRGVYVRSFFNLASIYCKDYTIKSKVKTTVIREALAHPLIRLAVNELSMKSEIPFSWKIQWFLLKIDLFLPIYVLAHVIS